MSYSITVRAATVLAALAAFATKFDEEVVKPQPVHAKDREPAVAAVKSFTDLLGPQPEGHDVTLTVNGSLGWDGNADEGRFRWVNFGVSGGYSFIQPAKT